MDGARAGQGACPGCGQCANACQCHVSAEKAAQELFSVAVGVSPGACDDRLGAMWDQQVAFMRLLQEKRGFPEFPTDISSKKGQQFLNSIRHHLQDELHEASQHLRNHKQHRVTDLPEVDREAYKEELVDALHLYFELVIASGISLQELVDAYMKKGETNDLRICSGY